jgi:uncharacterized protein YheU (UPF0270 family)
MKYRVNKIVSGGQTGADRGGLDAAIALGIVHGGWCPKGRRAEDGEVPAEYHLRESDSSSYENRTRRNVTDSDGTVIFTAGPALGGTKITIDAARQAGKPVLPIGAEFINADPEAATQRLRSWLVRNTIRVLNVAGPRESSAPGLQALVSRFLTRALTTEEYEIADDDMAPIAADAAAPYSPSHRSTRTEPEASEADAIIVPHDALRAETLRAVIEEFVSRSGTDYGEHERSLADKTAEVLAQLQRGEAVLVLDPKTQTVNIVARSPRVRER